MADVTECIGMRHVQRLLKQCAWSRDGLHYAYACNVCNRQNSLYGVCLNGQQAALPCVHLVQPVLHIPAMPVVTSPTVIITTPALSWITTWCLRCILQLLQEAPATLYTLEGALHLVATERKHGCRRVANTLLYSIHVRCHQQAAVQT